MRIQFSANSKYVNFAISSKPNVRKNDTFTELTDKEINGIGYVTFKKPENTYYLYMNVFLTEDSKNKQLNNFVFKYINAFDVSGFQEYKFVNNDPKVKIQNESDKKYKVTFNPIEFASTNSGVDTTITYTVKILTRDGELTNENINMIAMSESNIIAKRVKGSTSDKSPITVELTEVPDNFKSVQVVSSIIQGSIIEYVAYQAVDSTGKEINDPDPIKGSESEDEPEPKTDVPVTDTPKTDEPKTDVPITDTPKTDTPKTDTPKTDEPKPNPESNPNTNINPKDDRTIFYIVIGVVAFLFILIFIILIVVCVRFNKKNKDLLDRVNKISFAKSGAYENSDLLINDNRNELD